MGTDDMGDVEYLVRVWNVDEAEVHRRAAHLAREMIEEQIAGGEIILKKGRRKHRLRFLLVPKDQVDG